jgi:hypothetical protein
MEAWENTVEFWKNVRKGTLLPECSTSTNDIFKVKFDFNPPTGIWWDNTIQNAGLCDGIVKGSSRLGIEPKTPGWLVQDPTTSPSGDLIPTSRGSGAHPGGAGTREEPGTITQGGALFSLAPLVCEPKTPGCAGARPNHQPIGGSGRGFFSDLFVSSFFEVRLFVGALVRE